eukprot:scaffold4781_cov339-Prasinococcus_capsulatus_cf.AAC.8
MIGASSALGDSPWTACMCAPGRPPRARGRCWPAARCTPRCGPGRRGRGRPRCSCPSPAPWWPAPPCRRRCPSTSTAAACRSCHLPCAGTPRPRQACRRTWRARPAVATWRRSRPSRRCRARRPGVPAGWPARTCSRHPVPPPGPPPACRATRGSAPRR